MDDDATLLKTFARERSDAAFDALSRRYVDLVYSAALRQLADAHLAEDVTQAVFVVLAQKAASLPSSTVLPAWLLSVTRLVANNARRQKSTQRKTAEAAMEANRQRSSGSTVDWAPVAEHLDDALADLSEPDRDAVVLRFFQRAPFEAVATSLGISTDAAKKRVSRALEKMHRFFQKRGVSASAVALATLLAENAVHAAPVALATSVPAAIAAAQGGVQITQSISLAKGALHTMAMVTVKKTAALAAALLIAMLFGGLMVKYVSSPPPAAAAPEPKNAETKAEVAPPTRPAPAPVGFDDPPPPLTKVVKLLPTVDPLGDAVNGDWSVTNGELHGGNQAYARIEFPYQPPAEYDYRIAFTVERLNQDILLICAKNGTQFAFKMGVEGNRLFIFETIGKTGTGNNPTRKRVPRIFTQGARAEAVVKVRDRSVSAFLNGVLVNRWDTDYTDMSLSTAWKLEAPNCVGLGSFMTPVVIHEAEITEVTGRGLALRPEGAPAPIPQLPTLAKAEAWDRAINVLEMIDPKRDAVAGTWSRSEKGLVCAAAPFARLEIPYMPPEEYDFRVTAVRESGDNQLQQFLFQGGKQFQWCVNGWGPNWTNGYSSFHAFEQRFREDPNPSSAIVPGDFAMRSQFTSVVQVRRNACNAFVNGKLVSRLTIGLKDARLLNAWRMATPGMLGVGAHNSGLTITRMEVLEITGEGEKVEVIGPKVVKLEQAGPPKPTAPTATPESVAPKPPPAPPKEEGF